MSSHKTIGDPIDSYYKFLPLWTRARAMLSGQKEVKEIDSIVNVNNILLPFSPSMGQDQYNFYKQEAEFPGLVTQYAKVLVGGLTRKAPTIKLPSDLDEEAENWIRERFSHSSQSLITFLHSAILEEIQTSRCWVYVDFPEVSDFDLLTPQEQAELKPYPIILQAESVINWQQGLHPITREKVLSRLVIFNNELTDDDPYHPSYKDVVTDYFIDTEGFFSVSTYERKVKNIIEGKEKPAVPNPNEKLSSQWVLTKTNNTIMSNGKRLTAIPAYPLNGSIDTIVPILTPLIDREVSLYNKVSRRNHLLLGSATYTPVVFSNMSNETFKTIVDKGLGSWIQLEAGDRIESFETPSSSLQNMEIAIESNILDMAKMGVRMLAPEADANRDASSGIALEIRNASQTTVLSSLSYNISEQLRKIVTLMLNWRYDKSYTTTDIEFRLNPDLNPVPLGVDWLRLVTEWYEGGLIPRSIFINIAKSNEIMPTDYDDTKGQEEISKDPSIISALKEEQEAMENAKIEAELNSFDNDSDNRDGES